MESPRSVIFGQKAGLFLGVGLVAGASVGLSVVLTRLYSAMLGHHLATLALSLALFGVALGGGIVTLLPSLIRPPHLFSRLTLFSALASLTSVVAVIQTLRMKPVDTLDRESVIRVLILYGVTAIPFTLIGCVIAAALQHARAAAARVYFADMLGAAAGSAIALVLLRLGAPRAGLALAIVFGLASVAFALGSRQRSGALSADEARGGGWTAAAFFLSSLSLFAGDFGEQWLAPSSIKHVNIDRAHFVRWNELALVTVDKPTKGMAWMRVDAGAQTAILDAKTPPSKHPDELAYVLSGPRGPTLVIGAGGGREVRAALQAGQNEVVAVEINRAIANEVMRGKMLEYSGGLYEKPEVEVVVADGRSYVRSTDRKFRNIVMSLVDTWAAASVGGLSLTEDGLYTVEAFRDYLRHLEPGGALVVNRWDPEIDRLVALASAALYKEGAVDAASHLYACSHARSTALLVKREPITEQELSKLRGFCRRQRFVEVFASDQPGNELRAALAADPWAAARTAPASDLSPPTDERPFFFYTVPGKELLATLRDQNKLRSEQQGLATLAVVGLCSLALAVVLFFLPAVLRPRELLLAGGRAQRVRTLLFFGGIGLGFVLVELALVQIFTTFLGHPVYALTTVLTVLLFSVGLGSWLVRRVPAAVAQRVAARRAQILTVVLVVCALALMPSVGGLVGASLGGRIAFAVAVLFPLGLLMGMQAPLGILVASSRSRSLVAWGWAINGAASVGATAIGTLLAMHIGFSFLLLVAAVAYFAASLLIPPAYEGSATRSTALGA
jgi:predicted membrane-bound spermidine synthase